MKRRPWQACAPPRRSRTRPKNAPGPTLPARELLGDMLLETHRPAEALAEYEAVLRDSPGRFNAIAGASRAALAARQGAVARRFAADLIALAKDGDGGRPEVDAARRMVGGVPEFTTGPILI